MLVFFTDTDTDFSLKEAKEYGCHLISMPYSVNDKEIYPYVDFKELSLATNNFTTNLNLLKGKYKNLTDITNINEEKYSKYEAENKTNYVILLKIGTGYFQVETTKNNKANIQKIISNIEG